MKLKKMRDEFVHRSCSQCRRHSGSMTEYAAIFNFIAAIATYSILSFAGILEVDYLRAGKCLASVGLGYGQTACFTRNSSSNGSTDSGDSDSLNGGTEDNNGDPCFLSPIYCTEARGKGGGGGR